MTVDLRDMWMAVVVVAVGVVVVMSGMYSLVVATNRETVNVGVDKLEVLFTRARAHLCRATLDLHPVNNLRVLLT